jgi:hypothetical protein
MSTRKEMDSNVDAARRAAIIAFARIKEAKRAAKDADDEARAARRNADDAVKDAGRSLRALRHALDLPAGDVARAADRGWTPNTLSAYVEVEDGVTVDESRAHAAFEYLAARVPQQETSE